MIPHTRHAVKKFIETWKNRGYEKGETQTFWYHLLNSVFGIETPADFISFERPVHLKNAKFIDAFIPSTKVLIEQKSSYEDLRKAKKQSDSEKLTPYEQALRYSMGLKYSERPRWIVISNFKSFLIYDMEKPNGEPFEIKLENLEREYYLLQFLVEDTEQVLYHEKEISIQAGKLIGRLYDEFHKQYINPDTPEALHSLNVLCIRLVFCLFAEDSGLFGDNHGVFCDYLRSFKPSQMRKALIDLFRILNTPYDRRDPYEDQQLDNFPFVNGGLFEDPNIEIPNFTKEIADLLLIKCGSEFDWSGISPTIFGALFEDTMNPDTREVGCMHYTSTENIHKVIDPLFLNDLKNQFKAIMREKRDDRRKQKLIEFQEKLGTLTFLDPACGSGNFLTETYLSLRRIENDVLEILMDGNRSLPGELSPIKIHIENFYGIEINDFAVTVAKAALWIAEAQMMAETERIVMRDMNFLPLKSYSHIECANALLMDWETLISSNRLSYIIGNPPFKGKKSRKQEQKRDLLYAIGNDSIRPGDMDLVTGWFYKAARFIQKTNIQVAFVSTINITRGEQVSLLWKSLISTYNICINFAYQPFIWDGKEQVHCTIIGFSTNDNAYKVIYSENSSPQLADNISPYIRNEKTVLIPSRNTPVCDVPKAGIGNKPIDNGNYLFKPSEKEYFVSIEPLSEKYFVEWYGAEELIKGKSKRRYFLNLANCTPEELREMPHSRERIENVRKFRSKSSDAGTRKLADFPRSFHVTNIPETDFIVIPEVTSENRQYIPMEYVSIESSQRKLFSNLVKILPDVTLFHFGVLQSIVHMIWTKAVCGYKDFRPRYSTKIVYNNFPWPDISEKSKAKIEQTALSIINARRNHPNSSLADLYDINAMPDDLRKAHRLNDAAVKEAYGFKKNITESEIIAKLLEMYENLTNA